MKSTIQIGLAVFAIVLLTVGEVNARGGRGGGGGRSMGGGGFAGGGMSRSQPS